MYLKEKTSKVLSLAQDLMDTQISLAMGIMQGVIQLIYYNINFLFHFTEEFDSTLLKLHNQVCYDSFVLMNNLLNVCI